MSWYCSNLGPPKFTQPTRIAHQDPKGWGCRSSSCLMALRNWICVEISPTEMVPRRTTPPPPRTRPALRTSLLAPSDPRHARVHCSDCGAPLPRPTSPQPCSMGLHEDQHLALCSAAVRRPRPAHTLSMRPPPARVNCPILGTPFSVSDLVPSVEPKFPIRRLTPTTPAPPPPPPPLKRLAQIFFRASGR